MADLVDKAEAELTQIMARITMATMQRGLRLSATVGKGIVAAPYKAAAAVWNLSSNLINKATRPEQGKVSLKQFTQLTEGKRDMVKLDDKAVSREFERELKRHGVTWTVEQHRDGSRTFHVQGKDAELIQHALGVAAARVDEKIARGVPELQAEQQPVEQEQPQQEQSAPEQTPEHDGTEQEQPVAERDDQVLDLDEAERSALADELRKYADYREGYLDPGEALSERAAELSNDPTYAYDEQATAEALEQEQEQIGQFQQVQIAAGDPYRELADQVEQTGQLDLTDDAVCRDVAEVIDNAGWRLDGDGLAPTPQPMQRVVEAVQAPRPQEQPQHDQAPQQAAPERDEYDEPVQAEGVGAHGTDELREDAPARGTAEDSAPEHDEAAATRERDEAVADRGGHSQQRETPAPVADRPPRQLSPRDETREKVVKRIDQDVKAKKEELRQSKTRTRNRTPGREAATEAREATRRR